MSLHEAERLAIPPLLEVGVLHEVEGVRGGRVGHPWGEVPLGVLLRHHQGGLVRGDGAVPHPQHRIDVGGHVDGMRRRRRDGGVGVGRGEPLGRDAGCSRRRGCSARWLSGHFVQSGGLPR